MFRLKFKTSQGPSLYPVNKERDIYARVKKTTAYVEIYNDDKTLVDTWSATVTCNPNERDVKVAGQYWAVLKIMQTLPDKETRKAIWNIFENFSKAAKNFLKSPKRVISTKV